MTSEEEKAHCAHETVLIDHWIASARRLEEEKGMQSTTALIAVILSVLARLMIRGWTHAGSGSSSESIH